MTDFGDTFSDERRREDIESQTERVAALLQRLLDAGTWYPAALEIEPNEDGKELERAIRDMLAEIKDATP